MLIDEIIRVVISTNRYEVTYVPQYGSHLHKVLENKVKK